MAEDIEKIDMRFDRWLHELVGEKLKKWPVVCDTELFIERCVEAVLLNGEARFEIERKGRNTVNDLKIHLPCENQYDDLESAEI